MSRPFVGGTSSPPSRPACADRGFVFFLEVGADLYYLQELSREPGDEARRIIELERDGGGEVYVAADCGSHVECTCPEWARSRAGCAHTRALIARCVFGGRAGR